MIKKIKKMIGLEETDSKLQKDANYIDNRTYVYAPDSVFTHPNIGASNTNSNSKPSTKEGSTDISQEQNEPSKSPSEKLNDKSVCNPSCPCWGQPTTLPRKCPICGHQFQKYWWGIDAHYDKYHKKDLGVDYQEWRSLMCDGHRPGK
ncbi:hypothetical protein [uncultured Methanolobus sp.]|uniref:hypothetical protein n=1 Tax=uncultured Methanolobus sp. TaxID=218300 RepID=UPI0029C70926|nr:hypothetical protein [uncultured Methanolobus sp.]